MPAAIKRVELKNGSVYEVEKNWPAPLGGGDLVVGQIFFVPETAEEISVGEKPERDEEESDSPYGEQRTPAHYEMWRVPKHLLGAPKEVLEKALEEGVMIICRRIYCSQVAMVDESWLLADAFQEMARRVFEDAEVEEPEASDNGAQPVASAP